MQMRKCGKGVNAGFEGKLMCWGVAFGISLRGCGMYDDANNAVEVGNAHLFCYL